MIIIHPSIYSVQSAGRVALAFLPSALMFTTHIEPNQRVRGRSGVETEHSSQPDQRSCNAIEH